MSAVEGIILRMQKTFAAKTEKTAALIRLWLNASCDARDVARLVELLMPYFRVVPAQAFDRADYEEERRQLIGEFLGKYREEHKKFLDFGNFNDLQLERHLVSRLQNFALSCQSTFRRKLVGLVNSIVRPAYGFKKQFGRIVGRIADIDARRSSPYSDRHLYNKWGAVRPPTIATGHCLPARKEMLPVIDAMFGLAEGWVFKKTFYGGLESVFGLKEVDILPFPETGDNEDGLPGLAELAPAAVNLAGSVELAAMIRHAKTILQPSFTKFWQELAPGWRMILCGRLLDEKKLPVIAERVGITQQGCGKAFRTMLAKLRDLLAEYDEIGQRAFIILLQAALADEADRNGWRS